MATDDLASGARSVSAPCAEVAAARPPGRVQQARTASNVTFTVTGLPAGESFACAVPSVDRTEEYDPAFLDQLVPGSFKLTIQDGEKKTQDLKLGGA